MKNEKIVGDLLQVNREKIFIYCIYFPTSNKYYVGQTYNIEKRMNEHLRSGFLVCKALWKYNDWQVSILHTCKTRDEANRIEIEDIRNLNCVAPDGYNLTRGGDGNNCLRSKETKERIRQAHLGKKRKPFSIETRKRMSEARRGGKQKSFSKEHKKKLSETQRGENNSFYGKTHSEEAKEKMRQKQLGKRCLAVTKRLKENNPMKNLKIVLKRRITCLKNKIIETEQGVQHG